MFGIPTPLLWAVVTVFAALIPFIGAASVWLPAGLYLVFTGSQTSGWWLGIGMLIYGAVVVSMIDNLIRPYLVSDAAKVHPAIVIVGAFGGALSIGFLGIFLGPLCLVLFVTFVELLFARV
jgi:predicted PurR-regulated permease PerM